jgi:catechol 2,3-dioxygenase-like lactoylglutathione lyase family enzyme
VSLHGAPLMYVFFETSQLETERGFFERAIGLPVLEIEPHLPHHRHGVVKYDAGNLIVSLNWTSAGSFSTDTSDGLITVFGGNPRLANWRDHRSVKSVDGQGLVTDIHGHHFVFSSPLPGGEQAAWPAVQELRLMVTELAASVIFYRDTLGLEMLEQNDKTARFATGGVTLALEEKNTAPDGRRVRYDSYLIVFYTPQIEAARAALVERGLEFQGSRIAHSEIGATARFEDPSGHRICIYEPSAECLSWSSGLKVIEIMDRAICDTQLK